MILPDFDNKFIPFDVFIDQLQLPGGVSGDTKRDKVVNYLATQPGSTIDSLLKRVKFSFDNGKLRADVASKRRELEAAQETGRIGGVEMAAGAGLGVLTVAEIFSKQHELIFKGTEREFHCPLKISDVINALEVKFAQEIQSGKLDLNPRENRLFFKNQAGEHLLTVILQSGQQDSVAYPDHPIATTVLKISQANLELLEEQVLRGVNTVLDQAIEHSVDNKITFAEGLTIGLTALSAFAPAAKTGGIGSEVLGVIAQELDEAERAYKIKRAKEIGQAIDAADADKAQRQCMFCGVERIKGEVSCLRCGGAYAPAEKNS